MIFKLVLAVSFLTLMACGWDKLQAIRQGSRISESILLGLALLGGSPGLVAGMVLFRHKIRKPGFVIPLAAIVLLQLLWVTWHR